MKTSEQGVLRKQGPTSSCLSASPALTISHDNGQELGAKSNGKEADMPQNF